MKKENNGIWENNADISRLDPTKPMIAFTFDDGPVGTADTDSSIRIQNALAAAGQHATFFYWAIPVTWTPCSILSSTLRR